MAHTNLQAPDSTAPAPPLNRWLIIAVICIPVFVGSLDLTVLSAFLPELIVDLELPPQTGLDDAAWILTGYLLAYTIGMAITGRLSDIVGRRRAYAISLVLFIAGSILVAIAHTWPTDLLYTAYRRMGERPDLAYVELQVLVFGRVVQALGAGALVPVSLALVGDLFPTSQRARPLGFIGAMDTLGWVLGHLYGGLAVNFFYRNETWFVQTFDTLGLNWPPPDWRTLFWINVPLTLFALVMTLWATKDVPVRRDRGGFDYIGAALVILALTALNIGLGANIDTSTVTDFDNASVLPPYAVPLVITSVIAFGLFVLVESRVKSPLFDLRLFRQRNISAGLFTNLIIGYCLFIGLVVVPILVNVRLEDTTQLRDAALEVGILLSTLTVPMALAAVPGGWLSEFIGQRWTITAGLLLSAVGFALVWLTWDIDIDTGTIAVQMALVGTGLGLTFSPISAAVINAAPDHERGSASALVIILRLIGMTISVSSLTAFALQRVNGIVGSQLADAGLDARALANAYATVTVDVLGELGLLGAILCVVAVAPALLIREEAQAA